MGHVIPAMALVHVLEAFQKVVHLIAMQESGRSIQQRFRVSRDIEKKFPLICGAPEDGSYAMPVSIGGAETQLFDGQECNVVAARTRDIIDAVNKGDMDAFCKVIPDSIYRPYVLSAFSQMQPTRHSGWVMHIEDFQHHRILDGASFYEGIKKLYAPSISEESATDFGYVAGSLIEMKFNEKRFRLKLLRWNRSIDATYTDAFEPMLLTHPRDLIQVHGNIVLNEDGSPQAISDVDDIAEIDEFPIEIDLVELKNGSAIRAVPQLQILVSFDRDSWLYQVEGPFDIMLYAQTRSEIETQVYEEIEMLWLEYAKLDPSILTDGAQKLRLDLLRVFREVTDAT